MMRQGQVPGRVNLIRSAVDRAVDYIKRWEHAKQLWTPGLDSSVFRHTAGNSEMSTRYILIDPILRALGWDISDPKQCVLEQKTEMGKPDYVLYADDGQLAAIIEAKRIDENSQDHWEQLYKYGAEDPPDVGCVTTGRYWSFWVLNDYTGEYDIRKPLALDWPDREQTAERLCRYLASDQWWQ